MSADESKCLAVGRAVLANFHARNARAKAAGDALRAEIRRVMSAHTGTEVLTAKRVLRRLALDWINRNYLPSERTIHWHMKRIKECDGA